MAIIYCYTNLINQKKYIGQTINPQQRYNAHKSAAFNPNDAQKDTPFHRAIRKYGWKNFKYEILQETEDINLLNQLEIFYINFFNTRVPNGYNILEGGLNAPKPMKEETKTKLALAKGSLTEEEVIALREAYAKKESPKQIYNNQYSNRLTYQAFLNIWSGRRYKNIKPELIQEGRHTKLTAEQVKKIKIDYFQNGLSYSKLVEKYNISKSTIGDIIRGKTWTHVQI